MAQKAWEKFDLIENTGDLQKYIGKMVYLLFYSYNMIGSTKLAEINTYLADEYVLDTYTDDPQDFEILYGLVLDVKELPMEIPPNMPGDHTLYTIKYDKYSTIEYEESESFVDVADYIEFNIDGGNDALEIHDFAVIFAKKMKLVLQAVSPGTEMTYGRRKALGAS